MTTHRCSRGSVLSAAAIAAILAAGSFLFPSNAARAQDAPPPAPPAAPAAPVPAPAKAPETSSEKVNAAIKRGVQFLYSIQKKDGSWENVPAPAGKDPANPDQGQWGGLTSMATYALLAAGENPQDPRLARRSTGCSTLPTPTA